LDDSDRAFPNGQEIVATNREQMEEADRVSEDAWSPTDAPGLRNLKESFVSLAAGQV